MTSDLPGWKYHRRFHTGAAVHSGALQNYQYPVKVIVGAGTDGAYTHQAGIQGSVMYVTAGKCRSDFYDFRFYCEGALCDYHRISKTDNTQAEFNVEVPADLTDAGTIDVYYGNFYAASDVSSAAATYVSAPIAGVVGAWTLEEADAEVNPTVIYDDDETFWTAYQSGVGAYGITITEDTTNQQSGTSCVDVAIGAGTKESLGLTHTYGVEQNWSTKSLMKLRVWGDNSGQTFRIRFDDALGIYQYRTITLNFSGWQTFVYPLTGGWSTNGTINLSRIVSIFTYDYHSANHNYKIDRIIVDIGVPAVDSSGYGNNGAATGTTIVAGRWAGKNARQFNGLGDFISVADNAALRLATTDFSIFANIKLLAAGGTWAIISKGGGAHANNIGYVYRGTNRFDCNNNDATVTFASATGFTLNTWNTGCVVADRSGNATVYKGITAGSPVSLAGEADIGAPGPLLIGKYLSTADTNFVLSDLFITTELLTSAQITALQTSYPDVGLVVGSVCPRLYAATSNPTHDSWEAEESSTSGDENYYYYQDTTVYTEKMLEQTNGEGIDWSQQATDRHLLDLSSSRILEEAKQLGLIKRRK